MVEADTTSSAIRNAHRLHNPEDVNLNLTPASNATTYIKDYAFCNEGYPSIPRFTRLSVDLRGFSN